MITDEQILVELARFMGWKIAPENTLDSYQARQEFFAVPSNYPTYDQQYRLMFKTRSDQQGQRWDPFSSWDAAMALAEKWAMQEPENWHRGVIIAGYPKHPEPWDCSLYEEYGIGPDHENWILEKDTVVKDKSGPRAICLALAAALGIEMENAESSDQELTSGVSPK